MKRRLLLIVGVMLVAAMTVWEVYEFLVTNEGVRYFTSEPRRLLPVMFLGVAGGIVALAVSRLSPRAQHKFELFIIIGIFVTIVILFVLGAFFLKGWLGPAGGNSV